MSRINKNSNYWIGNLTGSSDMWWREDEVKSSGKDLVALAGYRRAISNFVNIVTNKTDIPVKFNTHGNSHTDGKTVTLSASVKENNFDPTVGLALHEGSHIVHSDFELLKELKSVIAEKMGVDFGGLAYNSPEWKAFYTSVSRIKDLLNYVEDRRIDYLTFKSAPGYKNYYHSMYDKYFNFAVVTKALKSGEYRDATSYDSYEFRVINFTNNATDLNALPDLRKIYRVLNLKNISRLTSTEECLDVAIEMYKLIMNNVIDPTPSKDGEETPAEAEGSKGEELLDSNLEENTPGSSSEMSEGSDDDETGDSDGESTEASSGRSGEPVPENEDLPELTEAQKKSLENAIAKQKKLIDGSMTKSKLSKKDAETLQAVEESGAYTTDVGTGEEYYNRTDCIVVPRLVESMIPSRYERGPYDFLRKSYYHSDTNENAVLDGLRLGTVLGKKLQVRNEERTLKWTRQDSGRIDRRLIAELGFGNENVFQSTFTEKYDDAFLHISIDASGSMGGEKWSNSMKSAAAMCKAASMVGNIHVQVSIRTTHGRRETKPLIAIIYDSKVNKIVHIKKFWKHLDATGTTPEGLCFEAIEKQIVADSNGRDAYFLNLSDGMPYYGGGEMYYSGEKALKHTADKVKYFKNNMIKVLSFFITDGYDRRDTLRDFRKMYGKDAVQIDPTSVVSLAKVLNAKFLEA
jgi:hypothetical protein